MGLTFDQAPNDQVYMSAPASPKRISRVDLCFFSVPTSPSKRSVKAAYGLETEQTTPKTFEDSSSNADDFEFETSRRFNVEACEVETKDAHNSHGPAIAFADELFSDGKVMPLKPPPRLLYPNSSLSSHSPKSPSPRSPLRLTFQRKSLWNDDFDPFMVALENVKEEKVVGGKSHFKHHRRSRSMSPFRETANEMSLSSSSQKQQFDQMGLIISPTQQSDSEPNLNNKTTGMMCQNEQMERSPLKKLAEPKGVLFARKARLVKLGHENPKKPVGHSTAKRAGQTCTKGTKLPTINKFLFRSGSLKKISNDDKTMSSNATETRPKITNKFSFKANEEKRVSQVTKMTLVQYPPKLLLCMGYGAKRATNCVEMFYEV